MLCVTLFCPLEKVRRVPQTDGMYQALFSVWGRLKGPRDDLLITSEGASMGSALNRGSPERSVGLGVRGAGGLTFKAKTRAWRSMCERVPSPKMF